MPKIDPVAVLADDMARALRATGAAIRASR